MSDYLSSLGYPFRGRPMVFAFAVLIVWAMFLAAWAPLIGWIAIFCFLQPFMCAFFMKMVQRSAMGEEEICLFPELEEWLDDLMMPYIRLVMCMAVSFLPLVIYLGVMDWDMDSPLIWLFIAAGAAYFPGVFMRTSVLESFFGLSPAGWWGLVRKAPLPYAGLLGAICAGGWVILSLPSGFLMDFAMAPVKLYVACVLRNMCGLFMLKHEFAGEEEEGGFSISGPAAS